MAFMFENLLVYQKAVDFADQIARTTESFPRGYYFLTDQLNRAALSIATNLAEGNGRFTKPDRRNFFTIARGSLQECVPLIEVARRASEGSRCRDYRSRVLPSGQHRSRGPMLPSRRAAEVEGYCACATSRRS